MGFRHSNATARHGLVAFASIKDDDNDGNNDLNIYVIGGASKPGLDEVSKSNEIYHDTSNR